MNTGVGAKEKWILVVDDEESVRRYLATFLASEGYRVASAEGGEEAITLLKRGISPSLVILDMMMPEMDGLETLRKIREIDKDLPVVILSAMGQTRAIVQAMKLGASDYLTKPFENETFSVTLRRMFENRAPVRKGEGLGEPSDAEDNFISIDEEMILIKEMIKKIARTDATVLILGESGVGKELIARAIHRHSLRKEKPLVRVNCAAIPSELLESELFGFEQGAFTGAWRSKMGKFELADGGTIFLDEIAEMNPALQAKLLHVLQDGTFSKLGGKKDLKVDARVVAATNQNLERAIKEKRFREDLYYRLNVVKITPPPLRERRTDIPLLCRHFFTKFKRQYDSNLPEISELLIEAFMNYHWPGNIRELENMVRRLVVLKDEQCVFKELTLPASVEIVLEEQEVLAGPLSLREIGKQKKGEVERAVILTALVETKWNRRKASDALKISYRSLLYKIKDYKI